VKVDVGEGVERLVRSLGGGGLGVYIGGGWEMVVVRELLTAV
jgi:hypothetical protein